MNTFPKLHNALWPGLVGKGDGPDMEPAISLDQMLDLTANARCGEQKFDGVDLFLFHPHFDPASSDDQIKALAHKIGERGFSIGSMVAPVWPGTVGDSAMGDDAARERFLSAIRLACWVAKVLNETGVRRYGLIRIDSAEGDITGWNSNAKANTSRIAETMRQAADIAAEHGERLALEGEICWAGMHSWKDVLDLLEEIDRPQTVGFQADLAHTYLYLLGYNAPEHALLREGHSPDEFAAAYKQMTDKLRPWTIDFHVAQNDGTVHGTGSHDKTGRHCPPLDPNGKLDIVQCAGYWLQGAQERGIQHICWDGCMFPNEMLTASQIWNDILEAMVAVRDAHGWN